MINKEFCEFDFLSETQVKDLEHKVHQLREHWRRPWQDLENLARPFFTLGMPSYPFSFEGQKISDYLSSCASENVLLVQHFNDLFGFLKEKLFQILGEPIVLNPYGFAFPGFHIFLSHPEFCRLPKDFHADCQHYFLPWPIKPQYQEHWTFTVPLAIPESGARFEWKKLNYHFKSILGEQKFFQELDHLPIQSRDYSIGKLVMHNGFYYHRMSPWLKSEPKDQRITLQGHLVKIEKTWHLYW